MKNFYTFLLTKNVNLDYNFNYFLINEKNCMTQYMKRPTRFGDNQILFGLSFESSGMSKYASLKQ